MYVIFIPHYARFLGILQLISHRIGDNTWVSEHRTALCFGTVAEGWHKTPKTPYTLLITWHKETGQKLTILHSVSLFSLSLNRINLNDRLLLSPHIKL